MRAAAGGGGSDESETRADMHETGSMKLRCARASHPVRKREVLECYANTLLLSLRGLDYPLCDRAQSFIMHVRSALAIDLDLMEDWARSQQRIAIV